MKGSEFNFLLSNCTYRLETWHSFSSPKKGFPMSPFIQRFFPGDCSSKQRSFNEVTLQYPPLVFNHLFLLKRCVEWGCRSTARAEWGCWNDSVCVWRCQPPTSLRIYREAGKRIIGWLKELDIRRRSWAKNKGWEKINEDYCCNQFFLRPCSYNQQSLLEGWGLLSRYLSVDCNSVDRCLVTYISQSWCPGGN